MVSNARKKRRAQQQQRDAERAGIILDEVHELTESELGEAARLRASVQHALNGGRLHYAVAPRAAGLSAATAAAAERERLLLEATIWCTRMNFDVMKLADMSLAELHRLFTVESHAGQPPSSVLWALCELAALKAKRDR